MQQDFQDKEQKNKGWSGEDKKQELFSIDKLRKRWSRNSIGSDCLDTAPACLGNHCGFLLTLLEDLRIMVRRELVGSDSLEILEERIDAMSAMIQLPQEEIQEPEASIHESNLDYQALGKMAAELEDLLEAVLFDQQV
ncbi:hypothetical protein Dthio_PD2095 [Desulfonatronospira thiodismutans ASO3-1]|uniref:Uncharacterized protein n=1 Tax=Desulfonatronospira thiodismutans ASO3-1 TaxID=555779 RepID=D6SPP6_9BACT|nr:hypothetical protein [Desulfonatronospira thiodismutans]EFI34722.1 hypothetical protein Dthio_PD2095 [Desulfonatronospira thiodismutans ASO3-1]